MGGSNNRLVRGDDIQGFCQIPQIDIIILEDVVIIHGVPLPHGMDGSLSTGALEKHFLLGECAANACDNSPFGNGHLLYGLLCLHVFVPLWQRDFARLCDCVNVFFRGFCATSGNHRRGKPPPIAEGRSPKTAAVTKLPPPIPPGNQSRRKLSFLRAEKFIDFQRFAVGRKFLLTAN